MDLGGRTVDAAGLVADKTRVFDCVRESLLRGYQTCIAVQGRHFEHLLYIYFRNRIYFIK